LARLRAEDEAKWRSDLDFELPAAVTTAPDVAGGGTKS
jgi:hypothetical protein